MVSRLSYTLDCRDGEKLAAFWTQVLGYACRGRAGQFWPLVPPDSRDEPWFVLQQVDEPKSGKNRMHVDVHAEGDLEDEVRRVEALGARRISDDAVVQGDYSWVVMADPEGNEFCLVRQPG